MSSTNQSTGLVLISLGARAFTSDYLRRVIADAEQIGISRLFTCYLDTPELRNLRVIYGLSDVDSQSRVGERLLRFNATIRAFHSSIVQCISYSAFQDDKRFRTIFTAVNDAVRKNKSITNSYRTQTYRNLTPILKRLGVSNQRHPLVEKLFPYLIEENAVRLWFAETFSTAIEYGPTEPDGLLKTTVAEMNGSKRAVLSGYQYIESSDHGSLRAEGIGFEYKRRRTGMSSFELDSCDVNLPCGEISGLLGSSGSGKSTLLYLLAGHLQPKSGKILLDDRDITSLPSGRRGIASVFQDHGLFPHLTIAENIGYGLLKNPTLTWRDRKELIDCIADRLQLSKITNHFPGEISAGQRQRTAIARALITEPRVLLLDEPTASLDHLAVERLLRWLQTVLAGPNSPSVLVVSHDRDFLFSLCNTLFIIDDGQILGHGTRDELLKNPKSVTLARLLGTHGWLIGTVYASNFAVAGLETKLMQLDNMMANPGKQTLLVPPHAVAVSLGPIKDLCLPCVVVNQRFAAGRSRVRLAVEGTDPEMHTLWMDSDSFDMRVGSRLEVSLSLADCVISHCSPSHGS